MHTYKTYMVTTTYKIFPATYLAWYTISTQVRAYIHIYVADFFADVVVRVNFSGDIGPPCFATPSMMIGLVRPYAVQITTLVLDCAALSIMLMESGSP